MLTSNQVTVDIATADSTAKGPPKGADAPMYQSREAHHPERPLHSPEGPYSPGRSEPTGDRP
jgi:hypothetical protein